MNCNKIARINQVKFKKMKNENINYLSVFSAVNSFAKAQEISKPPQKGIQKATYNCPMHPDEMSSDPEKCAKCGMQMIKKEGDKK